MRTLNQINYQSTTYSLLEDEGRVKRLGVQGKAAGFSGESVTGCLYCPLTPENAAVLRQRLPWLNPVPLGLAPSFGFGDRLGSATPGHIQALRGSRMAPIFAQQSVRENARTGRTPPGVLDDAMWGVFQEDWRQPWGADADHLKTTQDVQAFVAAGYTFFTFDPGAYVDSAADSDSPQTLGDKVRRLPWEQLRSSPEAVLRAYLGQHFEPDGLAFDELHLLRAAAKYGRAVAHVAALYACLAETAASRPFEVEISIDETETPTSTLEHIYIASELRRLGVRWVSLAPRFVGRFEKGVDYIGSLDDFAADIQRHAAVARSLGPYKLSLHSGSDKFSIYPLAQTATQGLVHVKTAGTSYLEALRVLAEAAPGSFRQVMALGCQRYESERLSYHVSAELDKVPPFSALPDAELPALLDDFHARQVLHVTFGSILDRLGGTLKACLLDQPSRYAQALQQHFTRHLAPFASN